MAEFGQSLGRTHVAGTVMYPHQLLEGRSVNVREDGSLISGAIQSRSGLDLAMKDGGSGAWQLACS